VSVGDELQHVFSAIAIGPLTVPHRIVMGSMHVGLEAVDDDGRALGAFYAERAAAGAALIVTGGCAVSRVGAGGASYAFVNEDRFASSLARVADAVHEAGGRILLQLFHAGRYALEHAFGLRPVAPSAVYSSFSRCEPRALADAEVREVIEQFASGAARAAQLGYDGVELMGSEGYLLNQFMAPLTNRREDEWGGDAQRRMRFGLEVAAAVRAALGPGRAVVYRLSGADLVDGGAPLADVVALSRALVDDASVDAVNVGIGWHEARVPTVQLLVPHGAWRPWARAIRDELGGAVPVIASNRVNTVALAERVIAAGDADLVSLARPFLADPEIVRKGRDGRTVNVCIACDQACIDRSIFDRRVSCIVNPRAGHELEQPKVELAAAAVAVVGGGPAGMEAARALAACGARVTVLEASDRLGGQFRMACRIPGKEDYERTIEYFEAEFEARGVDVRLGVRIGLAGELDEFDAVVVATGVTPRPVSIPGAELAHVRSYASLLSGDGPPPDGAVAIVGAGGIGVDVAHLLSRRVGSSSGSGDPRTDFYARYGLRPPAWPGAISPAACDDSPTVTLLRRGRRIGERVGPSTRWAVLAELQRAGVRTLTEIEYERIEPGTLHVRTADGTPVAVAADTVVIAAGQLSERSLVARLEDAGIAHVVIGGAADAAELDAERAFRDGLEVPARIARLIGSRA
jgi:2,4-dienoyl-CoA reductase (NADPH2)